MKLLVKLRWVTDGAEYVGGNIEKVFDKVRQNMQRQHKTWEKYYDRKRRTVNIKFNDLVLVQTHFISAAGRRVVEKFMSKFEGALQSVGSSKQQFDHLEKGKKGHGTSNQGQMRRFSPPNEESSRGARVQSYRARETRTKDIGVHSAAEGRPVRSRRKPTVKHTHFAHII
ncbi:uncharacterized protein TNCV_1373581 [Trichonephila clavipes]|uniref:Uncharacterized protein n=1 Tax=Trichonephila clavipes TaxID=2585209 RepID=A0A8X7BLE1_TRICX|nr:uncharacterized protein TNCV_1373581 [Trichonephila clavipes]